MRRVLFLLTVLFLAAAMRPVQAGDWEITPFLGLRFGGEVEEIQTNRTLDFEPSGVFGLTIGRFLEPETRLEGTWSHQATSVGNPGIDITIDYLHFAGVYEPNPDRSSTGYVLASAGATLFDASGASISTYFSGSVGGGGRFDLGRAISLKVEARLWGTLTSGGGGVFCAGGCVVAFSGTGVLQLELSAGLAFAF